MKQLQNKALILLSLAAMLVASCQSNTNKDSQKDSVDTPVKQDAPAVSTSSDSLTKVNKTDADTAAISTARIYLQKNLSDDIAKGIVDTLSRKFIIDENDLDGDGKKEIFVGLTGPYFCGSGGCTFLLLNHNGGLITKFTVSDYPFTIAPEQTKGWHDLLVQSRGSYHRLKYNGAKYPSNPSVEPVEKILPVKDVFIVFDTVNNKYPWHKF